MAGTDEQPEPRATGPLGLPAAPPIDLREYGRPVTPRPGTNGLAIAALVFGLLGGLLGVIFGFVALSQIARTGQRGRRLAIGGLVAFGAWFLVIPIIAVVALLTGGTTSPAARVVAPASPVPPRSLLASSLQVGDCFDYTLDAAGNFESVRWLLCSWQHTAQIIGFFDLDAPAWPGENAIQHEASTRCQAMLAPHTALPTGMRVFYAPPSGAGWNAGNHQVACFLNMPAGKKTVGNVPLGPSPTR